MRLAEHAAERGAAAVAVIGPPYYAFDDEALFQHFAAIGRACSPTSFYLYEFEARAGYAIPLAVIARLRDEARQPPRDQGLDHAMGEVRAPTSTSVSTCSPALSR